MLSVYGLSIGCNTGIIVYINLGNPGNDQEYDLKAKIGILPIPLQLPPLLLADNTIYVIKGKFGVHQKMLCACKLSK